MTDREVGTSLHVKHPLGWEFDAEGPQASVAALWDRWLAHVGPNRYLTSVNAPPPPTPQPGAPTRRRGRRSRIDWAKARTLWDAGTAVYHIAFELGCSDSTIWHHAKAQHWPAQPGYVPQKRTDPVTGAPLERPLEVETL